MARRLDNNVGAMGFDNLIIKAGNVGTIKVKADQGILKRGSLVTEPGTDGAELATGGAGDAAYVITDDIDTTKETVAEIYKTGKFIRESLIVDGDIDETDIKALRTLGILVESASHVPA